MLLSASYHQRLPFFPKLKAVGVHLHIALLICTILETDLLLIFCSFYFIGSNIGLYLPVVLLDCHAHQNSFLCIHVKNRCSFSMSTFKYGSVNELHSAVRPS